MASLQSNAVMTSFFPQTEPVGSSLFQETYEANRHRLYAIAFRMTNNEPLAEELMTETFTGAFARCTYPSAEVLDRTLVTKLRGLMPLGKLTLHCGICGHVEGVRRNALRVHLELAITEVPPTERLVFLLHDVESYDHERIGSLLGLTGAQCQLALHQARLCIREHLAHMQ